MSSVCINVQIGLLYSGATCVGSEPKLGEDSIHVARWEHSVRSQNLSSKRKTSLRKMG